MPSTNARQLRGAVVVRGEHVPVRDEVVALVPLVLEPDGVAHIAGPVAHMEVPGGPEPAEDATATGLDGLDARVGGGGRSRCRR